MKTVGSAHTRQGSHSGDHPPGPPDIENNDTSRHVFIIAEAGVNHNASVDRALRMVEVAAQAGADAIKFQTFNASELVSRSAPKADYQQKTTDSHESHLDMLRRLQLDGPAHHLLMQRCQEAGIAFLSAPFDLVSLQFLVHELNLPTLKIPSGEITNAPLLLRAAASDRHIILSTGMATLGEVEQALAVLAYGYLNHAPPERPTTLTQEGLNRLRDRVTLLHCTSAYPAPFNTINLRAMDTLRAAFTLPVGLSDHSPGTTVPIAAAACGAVVLEKHFTLDPTLPGPDHLASLDPAQLTDMVQAVRAVEVALGDGCKIPAETEWKTRQVVRKSLVATAPIAQGASFTEANLGTKRPGGGLSPMAYWHWLGRQATHDYDADQPIDEER